LKVVLDRVSIIVIKTDNSVTVIGSWNYENGSSAGICGRIFLFFKQIIRTIIVKIYAPIGKTARLFL
jgi:hypothetical protein